MSPARADSGTSRGRLIGAGLAALALGLGGALPAGAGELVSVPTRPGVTVPLLLVRPAGPPSATVVLFPGGHGRLALSPAGLGWGQNNFLVRSRQRFAQHGLLVAVLDAPSDRSANGLWRFRTTAGHAEDVQAVIAALRRIADVPLWLVGTSMGTVSAANVAARLREGGPDGLVLTASVTRSSREQIESLEDVRVKDIRVPTLLVHHRDDACPVTRYADAVTLLEALTGVPRRQLLTFEGGDPPRSHPCEALSAHGFLGLEARVVADIAAWITERRP